jgi:hypothetical protein
LFSADFIKEIRTYEKALNYERKEDQIKWKDAINNEVKEMAKSMWEVIDEKNIPIDRRYIKNKRIFKMKRNGIFCARLLICGYSRFPGICVRKSQCTNKDSKKQENRTQS